MAARVLFCPKARRSLPGLQRGWRTPDPSPSREAKDLPTYALELCISEEQADAEKQSNLNVREQFRSSGGLASRRKLELPDLGTAAHWEEPSEVIAGDSPFCNKLDLMGSKEAACFEEDPFHYQDDLPTPRGHAVCGSAPSWDRVFESVPGGSSPAFCVGEQTPVADDSSPAFYVGEQTPPAAVESIPACYAGEQTPAESVHAGSSPTFFAGEQTPTAAESSPTFYVGEQSPAESVQGGSSPTFFVGEQTPTAVPSVPGGSSPTFYVGEQTPGAVYKQQFFSTTPLNPLQANSRFQVVCTKDNNSGPSVYLPTAMPHTAPPPPAPVPQWVVSRGSIGHPLTCGEACKYAKKRKGCKDGASCDHCHICEWRRHGVRPALRPCQGRAWG